MSDQTVVYKWAGKAEIFLLEGDDWQTKEFQEKQRVWREDIVFLSFFLITF